jgi:hypothetical protein
MAVLHVRGAVAFTLQRRLEQLETARHGRARLVGVRHGRSRLLERRRGRLELRLHDRKARARGVGRLCARTLEPSTCLTRDAIGCNE